MAGGADERHLGYGATGASRVGADAGAVQHHRHLPDDATVTSLALADPGRRGRHQQRGGALGKEVSFQQKEGRGGVRTGQGQQRQGSRGAGRERAAKHPLPDRGPDDQQQGRPPELPGRRRLRARSQTQQETEHSRPGGQAGDLDPVACRHDGGADAAVRERCLVHDLHGRQSTAHQRRRQAHEQWRHQARQRQRPPEPRFDEHQDEPRPGSGCQPQAQAGPDERERQRDSARHQQQEQDGRPWVGELACPARPAVKFPSDQRFTGRERGEGRRLGQRPAQPGDADGQGSTHHNGQSTARAEPGDEAERYPGGNEPGRSGPGTPRQRVRDADQTGKRHPEPGALQKGRGGARRLYGRLRSWRRNRAGDRDGRLRVLRHRPIELGPSKHPIGSARIRRGEFPSGAN